MRTERGNVWDDRRIATARKLLASGYDRDSVAARLGIGRSALKDAIRAVRLRRAAGVSPMTGSAFDPFTRKLRLAPLPSDTRPPMEPPMRSPSIPATFREYRRIRREIAEAADPDQALREGALLGIGIMLGAGFPGSAAAVSMLVERTFPDVEEWPWSPGPATVEE